MNKKPHTEADKRVFLSHLIFIVTDLRSTINIQQLPANCYYLSVIKIAKKHLIFLLRQLKCDCDWRYQLLFRWYFQEIYWICNLKISYNHEFSCQQVCSTQKKETPTVKNSNWDSTGSSRKFRNWIEHAHACLKMHFLFTATTDKAKANLRR